MVRSCYLLTSCYLTCPAKRTVGRWWRRQGMKCIWLQDWKGYHSLLDDRAIWEPEICVSAWDWGNCVGQTAVRTADCAWRSEPCGDHKGPQGFGLSIFPAVKLTDKPEFCTWLAQERKPSHCHERRNDNSFKTKCFTAIASSIPIACNKEEMQASLLMFYFYGPALFASDFHQFL